MKSSDHTATDHDLRSLYSLLPSVNDLLLSPEFAAMLQAASHNTIVRLARGVLLQVRQEIREGQHSQASLHMRLAGLPAEIAREIARSRRYSLRRVINAT